ncbi:MAG: 50S ribosomal protein L2 [Patescibacteria group bacterium]
MLRTFNPTSEGQRARKSLSTSHLNKKRPEKGLTLHLKGAVGRTKGRITSRSRQQGSKKLYRIVDYKRDKFGVPALVTSLEYDPYRGPSIALLTYADGEKRYILAPEGLKVGDRILSGMGLEALIGNAMPITEIPLATFIHNVEIHPGRGGQMVRGAGLSAQLLAKEGDYAIIKLPSGETRKILARCMATIGTLTNFEKRKVNLGKAGRNRHKGRRPHTRGVAMANPHDHPHAGSYKTSGIGMPSPKSPWGWKTKGYKTRKRKHTRKFIVSGKGK